MSRQGTLLLSPPVLAVEAIGAVIALAVGGLAGLVALVVGGRAGLVAPATRRSLNV